MLVVVSDTHRTDRPGLDGSLATAVREADAVVHAGDFTTESVLDGFQSVSRELHAVHGNEDTPAVQARLPAARTLSYDGFTIAVTHTQRGGTTGLSYFGAERGADLVIFGHTHRGTVLEAGDVTLLNPGSHGEPRGVAPSYAVLRADEGLAGEIRTLDGAVLHSVAVEGRSDRGRG